MRSSTRRSRAACAMLLAAALILVHPGAAEGFHAAPPPQDQWALETIDSCGTTSVGWQMHSAALDGSGALHVSYTDARTHDLRYATNGTGTWATETVAEDGTTGYGTSIAVASDGRVHIAFRTVDGEPSGDLYYATTDGGGWDIQAVETDRQVWYRTSIILDESESPHIGYRDQTNEDARHASLTGETWQSEAIASDGNVGAWTVLALSPDGTLHAGYEVSDDDSSRIASRGTSGWTTLHSLPSRAIMISIGVDSAGNVHAAFVTTVGGIERIYYGTDASGSFVTEEVATTTMANGGTSLQVGENGVVHIAFHDDGDLRYATNAGGDWSVETVEAGGHTGLLPVVLARSEAIHIVHMDFASGVIRHAVKMLVPESPTDLAAAALAESQIGLSWADNSTNESGFEIQRRTGSGNFEAVATADADATEFTDGNLEACTTYTYRVRAVNAAGSSDWSNEASATTPDTTPPVLSGPTQVTLVTDCEGSSVAVSPSSVGVTATDECDPSPELSISPSTVSPGVTEVTITATDDADNSSTHEVEVTLLRGEFEVGFLNPLEGGVDNTIKPGQTVPIKVNVSCDGTFDDGVTAVIESVVRIDGTGSSVANEVVEDSGLSADGGSTMRLSDGKYVYNLSTKGWTSTSGARFRVTIRVAKSGHVDTTASIVLKNR